MNVMNGANGSAIGKMKRNKGRVIKSFNETKRNNQSTLYTGASTSMIQNFQHLITQNENESINRPFNYYTSSSRVNVSRDKILRNKVFPNKRVATINQINPFIRRKNTFPVSKKSLSSNLTPKKTNLWSSVTDNKKSLKTPNSTINSIISDKPHIIIALTEGRGTATGEVGIAAMDLKSPYLSICQLTDTHSYIHSLTKINYFNPYEIIVPHTFIRGPIVSELYRLIRDQFPNVNLVLVKRRCFSNPNSFKTLKDLSAPEYQSVQLQIVQKFYALSAACALLRYVDDIHCLHFAPHSLKIEYHGFENLTSIDVNTAIWLELVESLSDVFDHRNCLLSVLNFTNTSGGLRLLRANILQPPCDEKVINTRLDCVEELLENNDDLMPALGRVMKQFTNVDKILCLCVMLPIQSGNKAGETQLNQTLLLKSTMDALPSLIDSLQMAKGNWFLNIKKNLENPKFCEISMQIKKVLQDDAHVARGAGSHFQRCFAVRPKINGLLDLARRSYSEFISDIQNKVEELSETHGLPLRLHSNSTKGFYILLSTGNKNRNSISVDDLPPIFIEVKKCGNSFTMTTEEIMFINLRAKQTLVEIQNMSNIIICELLTNLRSYMGVLYKLCENIAELDMILSLAQMSSYGKCVRPKFNKYLDLKDSIHPILECVLPVSPIPNNVSCSETFNFHIITGPNMGGKTIYIKQIALLQIMAQIGCYVPATSAVFKIVDKIFSRLGFNDDIECCVSTFDVEMGDIHNIIQSLTPKSLIIIDEICRGTECEEGTCVAWAICEYLLNTKAFAFFATHFLYLTKLQDVYYNVINLHTQVLTSKTNGDENAEKLIYKYKIIPGITCIDHYGLTLAKNTNMPKIVVNLAEDLIKTISKYKKPQPQNVAVNYTNVLLYKLATDLIQESYKRHNSLEQCNDIITKFKNNNLFLMNIIHSNNALTENNLNNEKKDVEIKLENGEEEEEKELRNEEEKEKEKLEIEIEDLEMELENGEEKKKELEIEKEEVKIELENGEEKKEDLEIEKHETDEENGLWNKENEVEKVTVNVFEEDIYNLVTCINEQDNNNSNIDQNIDITSDEVISCESSTECDSGRTTELKQNDAHKNNPITGFFGQSLNTTQNTFLKNIFTYDSSHKQLFELFSKSDVKPCNKQYDNRVTNKLFHQQNKDKINHASFQSDSFCPNYFEISSDSSDE